jgi:PPOX class probable F420-dependent enzyme
MVTIPDTHKELLEKPVYVTLVTVMPDGQPQASVVWCDYDGTHILVNTARGRRKEKNMSERPMATILAIDPENSFRYLEIRGKVVEITEDGAIDSINKLAKQYTGKSNYYGDFAPAEWADKEVRVICKIEPTKVVPFSIS